MTGQANDRLLNSVLINLSRSFLQYLSESSPWVREETAAAGRSIEQLAANQRDNVRELAEFLDAREWAVDFGSFPTEYTDLQFLSLTSLMAGLIHSQEGQLAALAEASQTLSRAADSDAATLLNQIRSREEHILTSLRQLNAQLQTAPVG
ncbi:MAG: hypothetical protein ACKO2P_08760 [Planctomycetota bacterium]